jgi:hypothetical protein
MAGTTVMVIHAPKEEKVTTIMEMASKMKDTGRLQAPGVHKTLGVEPCGRSDWVLPISVLPPGREGKLQKGSWWGWDC